MTAGTVAFGHTTDSPNPGATPAPKVKPVFRSKELTDLIKTRLGKSAGAFWSIVDQIAEQGAGVIEESVVSALTLKGTDAKDILFILMSPYIGFSSDKIEEIEKIAEKQEPKVTLRDADKIDPEQKKQEAELIKNLEMAAKRMGIPRLAELLKDEDGREILLQAISNIRKASAYTAGLKELVEREMKKLLEETDEYGLTYNIRDILTQNAFLNLGQDDGRRTKAIGEALDKLISEKLVAAAPELKGKETEAMNALRNIHQGKREDMETGLNGLRQLTPGKSGPETVALLRKIPGTHLDAGREAQIDRIMKVAGREVGTGPRLGFGAQEDIIRLGNKLKKDAAKAINDRVTREALLREFMKVASDHGISPMELLALFDKDDFSPDPNIRQPILKLLSGEVALASLSDEEKAAATANKSNISFLRDANDFGVGGEPSQQFQNASQNLRDIAAQDSDLRSALQKLIENGYFPTNGTIPPSGKADAMKLLMDSIGVRQAKIPDGTLKAKDKKHRAAIKKGIAGLKELAEKKKDSKELLKKQVGLNENEKALVESYTASIAQSSTDLISSHQSATSLIDKMVKEEILKDLLTKGEFKELAKKPADFAKFMQGLMKSDPEKEKRIFDAFGNQLKDLAKDEDKQAVYDFIKKQKILKGKKLEALHKILIGEKPVVQGPTDGAPPEADPATPPAGPISVADLMAEHGAVIAAAGGPEEVAKILADLVKLEGPALFIRANQLFRPEGKEQDPAGMAKFLNAAKARLGTRGNLIEKMGTMALQGDYLEMARQARDNKPNENADDLLARQYALTAGMSPTIDLQAGILRGLFGASQFKAMEYISADPTAQQRLLGDFLAGVPTEKRPIYRDTISKFIEKIDGLDLSPKLKAAAKLLYSDIVKGLDAVLAVKDKRITELNENDPNNPVVSGYAAALKKNWAPDKGLLPQLEEMVIRDKTTGALSFKETGDPDSVKKFIIAQEDGGKNTVDLMERLQRWREMSLSAPVQGENPGRDRMKGWAARMGLAYSRRGDDGKRYLYWKPFASMSPGDPNKGRIIRVEVTEPRTEQGIFTALAKLDKPHMQNPNMPEVAALRRGILLSEPPATGWEDYKEAAVAGPVTPRRDGPQVKDQEG